MRTRAALTSVEKATEQINSDPFAMGGFIPQFDRNGFKVVDVQHGTGYVTAKARNEDKDVNMTKISEDKKMGVWRAPYVHGLFDTRVVRRSNMLLADLGNAPYGLAFNFMEYAMLPPEQVAAARRGVQNDEAAKPMGQYGMPVEAEEEMLASQGKTFTEGSGPDVRDMSSTWSSFLLYAESVNGNLVQCSFVGSDGYFETSRMAVETALTLRFDRQKLPYKGGVLTPSVAGSTCLLERLISSGVKFKVGAWPEPSALTPPKIA